MKLMNKIFSVTLAGLFLLSFTGVGLFQHHCMACEITEYYLAVNSGQVEHHHNDEGHSCYDETENSCKEKDDDIHGCGIFKSDTKHCKTEFEYLKQDYDGFQIHGGVSNLTPNPIVFSDEIIENNFCYSDFIAGKTLQDYIDPPPKLVAKEFIIFTNRLKYC